MECKVGVENARLERELADMTENRDKWAKEWREDRKRDEIWCDRIRKRIEEIVFKTKLNYVSHVNLTQLMFAIFDDYMKLKGEIPDFGACNGTHCKRYVSDSWKFCPHCGEEIPS